MEDYYCGITYLGCGFNRAKVRSSYQFTSFNKFYSY